MSIRLFKKLRKILVLTILRLKGQKQLPDSCKNCQTVVVASKLSVECCSKTSRPDGIILLLSTK